MIEIAFRPMSAAEQQRFLKFSAKMYADHMVEHGEYDYETAKKMADDEVCSYFSGNEARLGEQLMRIISQQTQESIGDLWLSFVPEKRKSWAFIQWIGINKPYRRQGLAKRALKIMEQRLLEMKIAHIDLSVFAKSPAQQLYQAMGYVVTEVETHGAATEPSRIRMRKTLLAAKK
ncbi:MAG: GNAT family N-acetyltransferase [Gammaproteobacteria bacterium]|nr:GNAT family N-acetyltransferase [Gammaproteobacteria bacterium]